MTGKAGGFETLKGAIESACNVPAARATYAAYGRAAAAAKLKGIRTRLVATKTEDVKISVRGGRFRPGALDVDCVRLCRFGIR